MRRKTDKVITNTWRLGKLYKHRNLIDLGPEYQREEVWSKDKKQCLIDSILRGYDIPKIYLRVLDNEYYECIDGQQRLRAIFDFYEGKFPLSKKYSSNIDGDDLSGKKYEDLPINIQDDVFDDYELDVVEVSKCTDPEVADLFARLQIQVTLNTAEKLNAMPCKIREFVNELAKHPFFVKTNVRNYRYAFAQISAQITALELYGHSNIKFNELKNMYIKDANFDETDPKASRIKKTLNYLTKCFPNKTPEISKRANIVTLYGLISEMMGEYALTGKEDFINASYIGFEEWMNKELEKEKPDIEAMKYSSAMSHSSDGKKSIETRHKILKKWMLESISDLEPLDKNREFDYYQRVAIYRKDKGTCQKCGKDVTWEDFEADHKVPYSKGGKTTVSNGQCLCKKCNASKGGA